MKLLTVGTESDPRVFFLKMKGDYYRYMAEIAEDKKGFSIMFTETLSLSLPPPSLSHFRTC